MKKRDWPIIIPLLIVFLFFSAAGEAASLWTDNSRAVFVKSARHQVGDLLTLIIVEQSSAAYKTGTKGQEAGSFQVGPGGGLLTNLLPYLQAGTESSYNGSGVTNRDSQLSARLTVTVVDIEPETGNLLVEGRQTITINSEKQDLIVRGRIRPADVRADNTIYSSYMADAEIEYKGRGVMEDHSRPGIITRFFAWLF